MTVVRLPGTRSKYGAKRQGGHASIREDKRAWELKLLEKDGTIRDLREQVTLVLLPAMPEAHYSRPLTMRVDFQYVEGGKQIWEDTKGVATEAWKIRKRLARQLLGIEIREV